MPDQTDTQVDETSLEALRLDIASFSKLQQTRHGQNFRTNARLVATGILLAVGVTAAGFFDQGDIAGVLGLLITAFIAFQNAFFFNEKAEFQRMLSTEADNLLDLLRYRVKTQAQFDGVLDAFMILKKNSAANLPKGKGMEVVKEMYGSEPKSIK